MIPVPQFDKRIEIVFGATATPIHEQLHVKIATLRTSQKCADAITLLAIHGMISDSEKTRARHRLLRQIGRTLIRNGHGKSA